MAMFSKLNYRIYMSNWINLSISNSTISVMKQQHSKCGCESRVVKDLDALHVFCITLSWYNWRGAASRIVSIALFGITHNLCNTSKETTLKTDLKVFLAKCFKCLLATSKLFGVTPKHSIVFGITKKYPTEKRNVDFYVNAKKELDKMVTEHRELKHAYRCSGLQNSRYFFPASDSSFSFTSVANFTKRRLSERNRSVNFIYLQNVNSGHLDAFILNKWFGSGDSFSMCRVIMFGLC